MSPHLKQSQSQAITNPYFSINEGLVQMLIVSTGSCWSKSEIGRIWGTGWRDRRWQQRRRWRLYRKNKTNCSWMLGEKSWRKWFEKEKKWLEKRIKSRNKSEILKRSRNKRTESTSKKLIKILNSGREEKQENWQCKGVYWKKRRDKSRLIWKTKDVRDRKYIKKLMTSMIDPYTYLSTENQKKKLSRWARKLTRSQFQRK